MRPSVGDGLLDDFILKEHMINHIPLLTLWFLLKEIDVPAVSHPRSGQSWGMKLERQAEVR